MIVLMKQQFMLLRNIVSNQLKELIRQKNLRLTTERLIDFRSTMKEIVNVENHGKIPMDSR